MDNVTITTRYSGPTNTRGSRITATGHSRQLTVHYNYALGVVDNHGAAARALATVLGYTGDLRTVPARISNGYRWQACVAVTGLTVTADGGILGPTEVVPRQPATVFFTNH